MIRLSRRGMTLIELIYAMGLSMIVLAVGYGACTGFAKADEVEAKREQLNLTAHSAMARIKGDIRSASAVSASGHELTLATPDGRVRYATSPGRKGLQRISQHGQYLFKAVTASFSRQDSGVNVVLRARALTHRRVIDVDLTSYIVPRR